MSQDGVYADHVVVMGIAHMLERDIMIVTSSPGSGPEEVITWITGKKEFCGEPILIGHFWENHYQSLEPKGIF